MQYSIQEWVRAVFERWKALVVGGVMDVFAVAQWLVDAGVINPVVTSPFRVGPGWWVAGSLVVGLIVSFLAFHEVRGDREKLRARLNPDLNLQIHRIVGGDLENGGTGLTFVVSITNRGEMPSVAYSWGLRVDLVDGRTIDIGFHHIEDEIVLRHDDGERRYSSSDTIYEKVSSDPVEAGARRSGILHARTSELTRDMVMREGTTFHIRFSDVLEQEVAAEETLEGPPTGFDRYYPGVRE